MARKLVKPAISLITVILVFYFAFMLRDLVTESEPIKSFVAGYGYIGILVISIISGLNIIVPVPAIAFLPVFAATGLSLIVTVLVIGIGMTIGDSISFLIGKIGRNLISSAKNKKIIVRLEKWQQKNRLIPFAVLFLYASFIPLPNEILVIPLSFIGYKFRQLFPWLLTGNILFNSLVAFGIMSVPSL
jgi:membrane protein YqaA with SNARE-associated domain